MPFVEPIPKLVIAANRTATTLHRPPGARPIQRPPQLGDLEVCTQQQRDAIALALDTTHLVHVDVIRNRGGDWATLANTMQTRSIANITISCNFCYGGPSPYISSNFTNQSMQVCDGFNDRQWLEELIVTELVRLCGGTDLDAYAIKNFLFRINKSSYPWAYFPLLSSEKDAMCAGGVRQPTPWDYFLIGKFTAWDNIRGKLWPSDHSTTTSAVIPYGTSLVDAGITYWQHPC